MGPGVRLPCLAHGKCPKAVDVTDTSGRMDLEGFDRLEQAGGGGQPVGRWVGPGSSCRRLPGPPFPPTRRATA